MSGELFIAKKCFLLDNSMVLSDLRLGKLNKMGMDNIVAPGRFHRWPPRRKGLDNTRECTTQLYFGTQDNYNVRIVFLSAS